MATPALPRRGDKLVDNPNVCSYGVSTPSFAAPHEVRTWDRAENFGSATTSAAIRGTRDVSRASLRCPPMTRNGTR